MNDIFYFLHATNVQTLRRLKITRNNSFGNSDLRALAEHQLLNHLEELHIESCPIDMPSVIHLLETSITPSTDNESKESTNSSSTTTSTSSESLLSSLKLSVGGMGKSGSHLDGNSLLRFLAKHANAITLNTLSLQGSDIDIESMGVFAKQCGSSLLQLTCGGRKTNDDIMECICLHYPTVLKTLSLSQSVITNVGVGMVASKCIYLHHLDLSWCNLITDVCVEKLTVTLLCLRELIVKNTKKITDVGIKKMLQHEKKRNENGRSSLLILDARNCESIFVTDRKFVKAVEQARSGGMSVLLEGSGRM